MRWSDVGEQPCSVARSLAHVGDRWTVLVLRECFRGASRFEDIQVGVGASRATISDRLGKLVGAGVIERIPYQKRPPRHDYRLTEKGRDLWPVLLALMAWGDKWLDGGHGAPFQIVHHGCGEATQSVPRCAHCGETLRPAEISLREGPGIRWQRRRRAARAS